MLNSEKTWRQKADAHGYDEDAICKCSGGHDFYEEREDLLTAIDELTVERDGYKDAYGTEMNDALEAALARNAKLEAVAVADRAYRQARDEFNINGNEHTARILSEAIATYRAALDALDD